MLEKDNIFADLLDDDDEPVKIDRLDDEDSNDDVSALKAQIAELEKERQGLLSATKDERRKRQSAAERLAQLEGAVSSLLSQRQQQGMESVTEAEAADARKLGIPVSYDDDGNGWIDPTYVNQLVSPYAQKIQELEQRLQLTNANQTAVDQAEKVRLAIIGEDERYVPASNRYRAARRWVEDVVSDYTRSNGINRNIYSGEALDQIFDRSLRREFEEEFPGLDIVDIVTAEDSKDHFRRTLSNIAKTMTPETDDLTMPKEKMDSRFQQVLNKPSSLGNQANAKAGQLSIMDRIQNLKASDIMDFDDKSVETLMRAMRREELGQ